MALKNERLLKTEDEYSTKERLAMLRALDALNRDDPHERALLSGLVSWSEQRLEYSIDYRRVFVGYFMFTVLLVCFLLGFLGFLVTFKL